MRKQEKDPKGHKPSRRVLARVLAENLREVHGGDYNDGQPVDLTGKRPVYPTISEAATSESIPDS